MQVRAQGFKVFTLVFNSLVRSQVGEVWTQMRGNSKSSKRRKYFWGIDINDSLQTKILSDDKQIIHVLEQISSSNANTNTNQGKVDFKWHLNFI